MIAALVLLATLQQPNAAPAGKDTAQGRPCVVVIDTVGHNYAQTDAGGGQSNSFMGGRVRAHCQGTQTRMEADSVAYYGGSGRFDMIGQVKLRDTALALDAATASYYLKDERLDAHKNVVAVNNTNHSILRGPNLTYWRAVPGVRDTLEMYATSRPTIWYRGSADNTATDSVEPYVIVADRVRFKGNDRMWGGGKVTIDRSDLATRSDSLELDQGAGFGTLLGRPHVEGKQVGGATPYALDGRRIDLALRHREISRVKALGQGKANGADWRLTADTIDLRVERHKLQQAFAWGDSLRPHAISTMQTFDADSLAIDSPDQVLTELRGFGGAFSTSKRDSTPNPDVDWIAGDTLTAHWIQEPDSTGKARAALQRILSHGSARSLTHMYDDQNKTAPPSLNYSRGMSIAIALLHSRIDRVVVGGRADGVQLEPRPVPRDTTKADSSKADSTRRPSRPPRGRP